MLKCTVKNTTDHYQTYKSQSITAVCCCHNCLYLTTDAVTASATEPRATTLTLTGAAELSDQESVRGIAGAVECIYTWCLSSVIILDNSASYGCNK